MNNFEAEVLVFGKPVEYELEMVKHFHSYKKIIVDICDDIRDPAFLPKYDNFYYNEMIRRADQIVVASEYLKKVFKERDAIDAVFIGNPYEFDQADPHCKGNKLIWYGHPASIKYAMNSKYWEFLINKRRMALVTLLPDDCIFGNYIPWSLPNLLRQLAVNDIYVQPKSPDFKGSHRAVEAIRRGCFVVADPHPSLVEIPGIWKGDIVEGIEWATSNLKEANEWTKQAQIYVEQKFHPRLISSAWREILEKVGGSILDVEKSIGKVG
jgi:hypothetical protein